MTLAARLEEIDLMSNILVNAPKTAKRGAVVEIKALIHASHGDRFPAWP